MKLRWWAILIGVALLGLGLGSTALAAPGGNGNTDDFIPPGLAKVVFIHYDRGHVPEGVPGGRPNRTVSPACSDPATDGTDQCDSYSYSGIHWADGSLPVHYAVNLRDYPGDPAGVLDATTASAQTWEDDPDSYMDFTFDGTTGRTPSSLRNRMDGNNDLGWGSLRRYPNAIAVTIVWYYTSTGEIAEADMIMNKDLPWSASGASNAYDVQNIVTHEFGHFLLLNDLYDQSDSALTMYGYGHLGETKKSDLGLGDMLGIRAIYPGAGAPPPPPPPPPDGGTGWGVAAVDWSEKHRGRGGSFLDLYETISAQDGSGAPATEMTVDVILTWFGIDGTYSTGDDQSWNGSGSTNGDGKVRFKLRFAYEGKYRLDVTGGSEHDAALDVENPSCYDTATDAEIACP